MPIATSRRLRPRVEQLEDRTVPSGITKVRDLGTAASPNSTSVNLTLTAGVTAGDSVVVEVAIFQSYDQTTSAVTVTDAGGNAYAKDADVASGSLRALVFSAHHVHALPAGGTLTITLAFGGMAAASAAEFAGLGAAVPVDTSHTATGLSASPSSGQAATAHADDLLVGAFGVVASTDTFLDPPPASVGFTPGAGYTTLARATSTSLNLRFDLVPEFRTVSAVGSYAADGSFGDSRGWAAALVAYRGLDPPPPSDLPAGLSDVTAAVSVTARKPVLLANGRTRLRLTLRNRSGNTHTGPLSLVLTNLPRKARLRKGSGFTALVPPVGRPYLSVQPGGDGLFSPGEVLHVTLELTGTFPRKFRPTFRIVAGAGVR